MDKLGMYENFVPSMRMSLFYDEIYSSGLDRTARFPIDRYSRIADKIQQVDTQKLIELKQPRLAQREEILLVHDEQYVDRFLAQELRDDEIRRIGLRPNVLSTPDDCSISWRHSRRLIPGGVSVRCPARTKNSSRVTSRWPRCAKTFGRWSSTSTS